VRGPRLAGCIVQGKREAAVGSRQQNQMGRLREVGNWGVAKRVVLNETDQ
jgi:hypothetical protein